MIESMIGKKVKVSLKNEMYYKGLVLSEGEDYIKIKDIRNNIVHIKLDFITVIQEMQE